MSNLIEIIGNNLVALVIGTLLGSELTRFLYKPHVIIQLRKIKPLYSKKGFFISIQIANKGRTVASKSIGNISINYDSKNMMNPEDYKLDEFEESLPTYSLENIKIEFPRHQLTTNDKVRDIQNSSLCWSKLGNPSEMDINPGSSQGLDICRAQFYEKDGEKFWYLIFPCEQGWRKVRARIKLNPKEELNGKLFVCPDNVFPTVRKFSFYLDGNESTPVFKIKKYSFIEKVYYTFNRSKMYFD